MLTQQPAAPSASAPKPSRSLSGSLCALFSDADSGSGMKAELRPGPGVSVASLPSRLPSATQEAVPALFRPSSHPVSVYFSVKPGDFTEVLQL